MSSFSLESREIRPSTVFGTRRKAALRRETYAWASDLRSFNKLQEVGDSPYLGFTFCLRAMLMFQLVEALNGRLIGPKTWDGIVRICFSHWTVHGLGVDVRGCLGVLFHKFI